MDAVIKQREENRSAIKKAVDDIIIYSRANQNVSMVIQYGSTARGRVDALSDLDVLIIMESDRDFFSRSADVLEAIAAPVDVDIVCYTPGEVERNRNRPFLRHILHEGKVIYEK